MYKLFEASLVTAPLPVGGFVLGPLNANVLRVDQKNIPTMTAAAASAMLWIFFNCDGSFIVMMMERQKGWSLGSLPRTGSPLPQLRCSCLRAASKKRYFGN